MREVQRDLSQSSKALLERKLADLRLGEADGFRVYQDCISAPRDGLILFKGMNSYTSESIKSLEGIDRAWFDEAQMASPTSLQLLRPTIRAPGSELWFSWNPRRKGDPIDVLLRGAETPTGSVVVQANWGDNPWFPAELEQERLDCLRLQPDQYDHIWNGGYATVSAGAYYAAQIADMKREGRLGRVSADPLMTTRAIWDIGGTGARADACAIWIAQFVGREIRVLDYYEAQGQPLAAHIDWLRRSGYGNALCVLPHDGATNDKVYAVSYESSLRDAGFEVIVVPNQGRGAAMFRIEAARRLFPSIWINEATTSAGLDALGAYHAKIDEARQIDLGPEHDWASHACFDGNTLVLTRYGTQRIMDLPETGEVLTPCGWKRYIAPRVTRRAAPLVEVEFTGGYSVKCTPDHLFMTESGWKSAASLTTNTAILSTLTKSRSISMAASTACGQARFIYREAARAFTGMFGGLLSVLSPMDATSTIATGTCSTIGSKTSNACPPANIWLSQDREGTHRKAAGFQRARDTKLLSGILRQKGDFGISGMLSAPSLGQSGSARKSPASIAASLTWRLSAKVEPLASSALRLARSLRIGSAARRMNTHVTIASVRPLNETADVWDITVPDGHWFSLANGAVVHNCDAFGLMCITYEQPQVEREASPRRARSGWMG
jgi:phage terminase large subunit